MNKKSNENIYWHNTIIKKNNREQLLGQISCVLWFTGLSGSGKSTIANNVEKELFSRGVLTYLLDGDNIRNGLNKDLGFDKVNRMENIRRLGEVSKLFVDCGVITLTAFISPYEQDREKVRKILEPNEFIEIYTKCPIEICEKRDPKGLYKKARNGILGQFTGISSPYQPPSNPEIILETNNMSVDKCTQIVVGYLQNKGFV